MAAQIQATWLGRFCTPAGLLLSVWLLTGCGDSPAPDAAATTPAAAAATPAAFDRPVAQQPQDRAPVHQSDELAAHPNDPDRMARGVAMEEIIPRLALSACEEAVAAYPKEARFRYQLGRAMEASGRSDDAFKAYETAAKMGYRMAHYNIGICYANGEGVAVDVGKAREAFQQAVDLGVAAATDWLAQYVFSAEGFSHPAFFQAIYEGNFDDINADSTDMATYLVTFVKPFMTTEGCSMVISRVAYTKLDQHAQIAVLGRMLGGMAENDRPSRDFVDAAVDGYRAGERFNVDIAAMIDKGHEDAQLFYGRYGCDSHTARTFFANVETYANDLGDASLEREFEKHRQR